jgi:H+/Cl- antiporter ClcA
MPETKPIVLYPDPPTIALRSSAVLAGFGAIHLAAAALFPECLQALNLVLGLLEILIAAWIATEVSRWRKQHDEWVARQQAGSDPPPSSNP